MYHNWPFFVPLIFLTKACERKKLNRKNLRETNHMLLIFICLHVQVQGQASLPTSLSVWSSIFLIKGSFVFPRMPFKGAVKYE